MSDTTEDVLDWFLTLQPEVRRRVLDAPAELSPRRVEKRAELAEWVDHVTAEGGMEAVRSLLMERGLGEDDAEEVLDTVAGFEAGDRAEDVADGQTEMFRMVGREVLESYTGGEPEPEARQEFDVEDTADLRLLLSRTVVSVSCGDVEPDEARRQLERSGASDESVRGFVDELRERLDEVDLHLHRAKVDRLSNDIRSLRWDSLDR